jgi:hypothetical protein
MKTYINFSKSTIIGCLFLIFMGLSATIAAQTETREVAIPLIKANIAVSYRCQKGRTCSSWSFSTTKVNAITITNLSATWYPSLQYTIYTGPNLTGTALTPFVCNQSTVIFASPSLANGAVFSIKLKDVNSSNYTYYNFTNGSFNGLSCAIHTTGGAAEKL